MSIFEDVAVWHRAFWLSRRGNTNSDRNLFELTFECDGVPRTIYVTGQPLEVIPNKKNMNVLSDEAYLTTMTIRFDMPDVFVFTATLKSKPHTRGVVDIEFDFTEFHASVLDAEMDIASIEHIMTICVLYMSDMKSDGHMFDM